MSMFAKAKTIAQKPAAKAAKQKQEFPIKGIEKMAAIDAMIKSLETLKETECGEIKPQMLTKFLELGGAIGATPENFRGVEGLGQASCELRRRSSTSPLSEAEREILKSNGIDFTCVDVVADTFVINPIYATDEKLLERVGKALEKVKDIPEDFIMKQEGKQKYIVGENCLDQAFKLGGNAMRTVVEIVGVLACGKAQLKDTDPMAPFRVVLNALGMEVAPKAKKAK